MLKSVTPVSKYFNHNVNIYSLQARFFYNFVYDQAPVHMHIYKITFVKNKIDSCKLVHGTIAEDICQRHNGFLIYAIVRAETEIKAREKGDKLIKEFM